MPRKEKPQARTFRLVLRELYRIRKNDDYQWSNYSQYVCSIIGDLQILEGKISEEQKCACRRYIQRMLGNRPSLEHWIIANANKQSAKLGRQVASQIWTRGGERMTNNTRIAWVKHIISVLEG